jgi:hypothetical protein
MARKFKVYKGLQRPLIYKSFKGKFIYWGLGAVLAGLVLGALAMSLINMWFGAIVLCGSIVGGLLYVAAKQKQGLHQKSRASGIYIHPLKFRKLNRYVPQTPGI